MTVSLGLFLLPMPCKLVHCDPGRDSRAVGFHVMFLCRHRATAAGRMRILVGKDAEPYMGQAQTLMYVHNRSANTAIHAAEIMGADTYSCCGEAKAAVAVCDKGCVPAVPTVRPIHCKALPPWQVDTLLVSASPRLNQPAIALALLCQAQLALPPGHVLLVNTSPLNQQVYAKAGFQETHQLMHQLSRSETVMVYTCKRLGAVGLRLLANLDGRNPGRHPVIHGCNTRDCHCFGVYECPKVRVSLAAHVL